MNAPKELDKHFPAPGRARKSFEAEEDLDPLPGPQGAPEGPEAPIRAEYAPGEKDEWLSDAREAWAP